MITLPERRPATLRSFWLVAALSVAVPLALIAARFLTGVHAGVLWALFSVPLVAFGMAYPYAIAPFYRVFNGVVRFAARRIQTVVLSIWFTLVLSPMARTGVHDALCLSKPEKPLWRTSVTGEPAAKLMARGRFASRWSGLLASVDSESSLPKWMVSLLLPLFLVLLLLDTEEESGLPSEIYTLF